MTGRRVRLLVGALLLALLLVVALVRHPGREVAPPSSAPAASVADDGALVQLGSRLAPRPVRRPTCDLPGKVQPFAPVLVTVAGVTSGAPVLALGRDANGVPETPPVSTYGKGVFAWDRPPGIEPGARHGNVLLNAHTWPDGSALGNRLLAGLDRGGSLVLVGARGQRLCYRITERVSVLATQGLSRYYEDIGRPQVAIVVCSGTRLGPGNWTHRTVWFGRPVARSEA